MASSPSTSGGLEGKTILLVSTGSEKKRFVLERMKELGLRVVVLDEAIQPWAKPLIDKAITHPHGTPLPTILESVEQACNQWNIAGAITFWEEEVPLVAHICERCGFPGNSLQAAMNTRSKFAMHEMFGAHGEPAIAQRMLRSFEDLAVAIKEVGCPAVIKPLFGADSLSVVRVNNPQEAQEAYAYVLQSFTMPREKLFQYERGLCVYQRFIDGPEFSVECFASNGVARVVTIHAKTPMQAPFFLETGEITPPPISRKEEEALAQCALGGLRALGVRNSLAHVEIKYSKDGPQIIEMGSRMGGDNIFLSTLVGTGVDLVSVGCEIALGQPVTVRPVSKKGCVLSRYFIPPHSGIIEHFNVEAVKSFPWVEGYDVCKRVGEAIVLPPDGFENAGWVIVSGATLEETTERMAAVMAAVDLRVRPL